MKSAPAALVALCLLASTSAALASAPAEEARAAYERGTRAFKAGDFAVAAREFARADALVPSDAAIEAALETSLRAGDPVLGMELVDRARSRSLDSRAERSTARVAAAFSARVGRLMFPCAGAASCRAFVDGVEVERPRGAVVVMPGTHSARIVRDEQLREVRVDVAPEATVAIAAPDDGSRAPSKAAASTTPRGSGSVADGVEPVPSGMRTSTMVATTTGILTLLFGGASALSYADLRSKRASFERGACGVDAAPTATPLPDCATRATSGRAAEVRTAVLMSATAVTAATTAAIVIFRPWDAKASVTIAPDLVGLSFQGRIP